MLHYFINILAFTAGAYFTGYTAKQVAFYWKKREDIVQVKLELAREKKKDIENILNMMVTLSSERRKSAEALIEAIRDSQRDQNIEELRCTYKASVKNWNVGLEKININMNNVGLLDVAIEIESTLHKAFFVSHSYLNQYFASNRKETDLLNKAKYKLGESLSETENYSKTLYDQANKQLSQINDFYEDSVPLNEDLYKVSILKLIKFIFYRRENNFRIG